MANRLQTKQELLKEVQTEVRRANAKLLRIQGHYEKKESWAGKRYIKKLKNLGLISEKGFAKANKDMSITELRAVLKASQQFNKSQTSTVKGIEKAREKINEALGESFEVDTETAEIISDFFGSDDYELSNEIKYEQLKFAKEIIDKKGSFEDYLDKIDKYLKLGNDEDMKENLKKVFDIFANVDDTAKEKLAELDYFI